MINQLKKQLKRSLYVMGTAFLLCGVAYPAATNNYVYAGSPQQEVCEGMGSGADCGNPVAGTNARNAVVLAINLLSLIGGVIAVIMVIIGGIKYTTSGGDTSKTASAKATIIAALIGLIVVALAQVIVQFVIKNVG